MAQLTKQKQAITLAWTGASGAPYGLRLLECLLAADYTVYLLISSAARVVLATEHGLQLASQPDAAKQQLVAFFDCDPNQLVVCGKEEWFSPVASGSAAPKQMVVCPCSAGSVAAIAHGMSDNLIERAADVVIKERGQLLLVVRETPFSTLHLENMHKLSQLGVTIMPAAPGFYHQPTSIEDLVDFMVARILDHLGIEQGLVPRWGYDQRP
ncbi:UbiX family flavin prenyltransferase [Vibrio cincinnatiensis]|jgi:4-hydroxy-3-polyprenylbenzoate decarboxylase|uniref:Flavin prenyltransferase UbiX n=1 Tax=Vibrio cincinnatiensis DSM 19608 TaxID=1123491 RepID=A0A1T4QU52_VIBCI|nr:flavin prenyltransferase UbiX [Vibrio cincinnatiensis]MCG3722234.1 UbiX family flavin prenyltransferase [Vibrio cincinnatiensis]MCG3725137.1 UbiX family flavin prenyltransferase [Vibrio cincinnatiensis]MCG3732181.1 UbiX family flavin prenyltransferase [Vibrio cincinnatiensis]MCG3735824.1 UbiX family flavin prenyltransferase [Vibrio cincinnatiensis]MCG3739602.1 UbiX family flavin prenyltransferase [Vibrio cincinnatiensis]